MELELDDDKLDSELLDELSASGGAINNNEWPTAGSDHHVGA